MSALHVNMLEKYFVALERGELLDYGLHKSMLRALKSVCGDNKLYDEFKNSYKDSCQLIDKVFARHKTLAEKKIRDPIEETRRQDMRKNPDWYQHDPANPSKDEIRTTELISAVEVAHFLLVKVGCDHKGFKNFLDLKALTVFGLAKLICAFTGDFKILEMYLRFASEHRVDNLMDELIEYLHEINSGLERYNQTERGNFEQMILEYISHKKAQEKIAYAFKTFVGDFTLAGRMKKSFGSMIFTRLVCENLDELGKRMDTKLLDLPRFAKNVDGKPFILNVIAGTVERGIGGMNKKDDHETKKQIFENSKKVLALSVPILNYVIKAGLLDKFKPARLRDQVDSILEDENDKNKYMKSFENDDSSSYKKLIRLLEDVRSLDKSEKERPAKIDAPKKPDDDKPSASNDSSSTGQNLDDTKKVSTADVDNDSSKKSNEDKAASTSSELGSKSSPKTMPVDSSCISQLCVVL